AIDAGDGTDVDDAAVAPRDHALGNGLRDEKAATQIRIEDLVPVIPGYVDGWLANIHAGIVHQDVDAAISLFRTGGHLFDTFMIANVQGERDGTPPQALDFFLKRQEMIAMTAGKDQVRAGPGERASKLLSEPATGTGHDGDAAREIKEFVDHFPFSPGVRMTFIKLAWRSWRRSNQTGPSSSGATTLMSGFTFTAPFASISMQRGYSPEEAAEPWSRICRLTTIWSGISTVGTTFPISVTLPPLRTASIAVFTVGVLPTASSATSTPDPFVRALISSTASDVFALMVAAAPKSLASCKRLSSISETNTCEHPACFRAWRTSRPIMPAPTTSAVSPFCRFDKETACTATANGSIMAASANGMEAGSL